MAGSVLSAELRGATGAVALSGAVFIAEEGEYRFAIAGSDDALLFLHESRLVEPGRSDGRVRLQAGWHPLRVWARNRPEAGALRLEVRDAAGQPVDFAPAQCAPELPR